MNLIKQIQSHLLKDDEERKAKTSFWATDCEKPVFDIYHKWMGTPETNPIEVEKLMMFNSAKLIEMSYVNMFDEMGILIKPVDGQHRVEMERSGVPISGYIDALIRGKEVVNPVIGKWYCDEDGKLLQYSGL